MKVAFLSRMRQGWLLLFLSSGGCKSAGIGRQKQKISHGKTRNYTEGKTLLSEPDALATVVFISSRWLLFFKKSISQEFYRQDAKYAKKHQTSPDFLSSFAIFASSRWECL